MLLCWPALSDAQSSIGTGDAQSSIGITKVADRIEVSIGEELFTAFNFKETTKPYLYPVHGPGQIRMTRDFPMKETAGEADDHPHHKSIWIGHKVNEIDFWTCRSGAKIVVAAEPSIDTKLSCITAISNWTDANGKVTCSDTTKWTFGANEKSRWIDCKFSLIASEGPTTINDTKEGTVAIRTHPDLRLKPDPKRGVKEVFGNAFNSQGTKGHDVWGQSASWVAYCGTVASKPASILILDHPENFRSPTTWHARDYGLVAANPFGLHDFQQMKKGAGAVKLLKGQSITLRYRFLFFGEIVDAKTAEAEMRKFQANSAGEKKTDQ